MAPLDQQALQPEHTCTLESACNPFVLTQKIGCLIHQPWLSKLVLTILVCTLPVFAEKSTYAYIGTHNNYPITVTYIFEEKGSESHISAIIDTEKIIEKNKTILKNNALWRMEQQSKNEVDGEHFLWTIQKENTAYNVTYKNTQYNESFNAKLPTYRNPLTLQGLVYTLRHQEIKVGNVVKANLITPWKTILPIRFVVDKKTHLNIYNSRIPAYKVHFEIDLFFGQFLPKSNLWVTEKKPHVLLKQSGLNKKYIISEDSLKLNKIIQI